MLFKTPKTYIIKFTIIENSFANYTQTRWTFVCFLGLELRRKSRAFRTEQSQVNWRLVVNSMPFVGPLNEHGPAQRSLSRTPSQPHIFIKWFWFVYVAAMYALLCLGCICYTTNPSLCKSQTSRRRGDARRNCLQSEVKYARPRWVQCVNEMHCRGCGCRHDAVVKVPTVWVYEKRQQFLYKKNIF